MTTRTPVEPKGERLYAINEVAELWSTSRDQVERLMRADELRWVQVGARRRIPASALEEYVERHRG